MSSSHSKPAAAGIPALQAGEDVNNKALQGMLHRWEVPLPTEAHMVVCGAG